MGDSIFSRIKKRQKESEIIEITALFSFLGGIDKANFWDDGNFFYMNWDGDWSL